MFEEITLIDYKRTLRQRFESRKVVGPYKWRPATPMTGRGFYLASRALEMDRHGSTFALRLKLANDCLPSYNHKRRISKYWADDHGDTTIEPIVALLPHGRGFLAGYTMGNCMASGVDPDIYDTKEEAASAAHDLAEGIAEDEREYQERERQREEEEE